jgi:5'(3')-deoxyribonucleotidase
MKIAIDLDGVVWDLMTIFIKTYNKLYNENVKFNDVQDWHYFPGDRFLTVYEIANEKLFEYPETEKNIYDHLYNLNIRKKHDVQILTHEINSVENLKMKLKCLNIVEGIHYNNLIKDQNNVKKVNYSFDIFIDDAPFMVEDIQKFPNKTLLLFDQPWNWNANTNYDNVYRVYSWQEVIDKIKELDK